jgi:5-methylcytosine-specific restriction endonuclease McrA
MRNKKEYNPVPRLRNAARAIWRGSPMRRQAKKRAMVDKENALCVNCNEIKPIELFQVDHLIDATPDDSVLTIDNMGEFIKRLFCPTEGLVAICKKCHAIKTKNNKSKKSKKLNVKKQVK